jgi:hypothetical protein
MRAVRTGVITAAVAAAMFTFLPARALACTPTSCSTGYECVESVDECLYAEGHTDCEVDEYCASDYCAGTQYGTHCAAVGLDGRCGGNDDCNSGYSCGLSISECKANDHTACSQNADCFYDDCVSDVCCSSAGYPCTTTADCCSGSGLTCQAGDCL